MKPNAGLRWRTQQSCRGSSASTLRIDHASEFAQFVYSRARRGMMLCPWCRRNRCSYIHIEFGTRTRRPCCYRLSLQGWPLFPELWTAACTGPVQFPFQGKAVLKMNQIAGNALHVPTYGVWSMVVLACLRIDVPAASMGI